jgi:hypothetical protein
MIPVAFSALGNTLGIRQSMVSMVSKTDPKQAKNPEKSVLAGIHAMPANVE